MPGGGGVGVGEGIPSILRAGGSPKTDSREGSPRGALLNLWQAHVRIWGLFSFRERVRRCLDRHILGGQEGKTLELPQTQEAAHMGRMFISDSSAGKDPSHHSTPSICAKDFAPQNRLAGLVSLFIFIS